MKDHIEKSAGLEAAAAGLVLRELTDAETGDVFGGRWGKVEVGPVTPVPGPPTPPPPPRQEQ